MSKVHSPTFCVIYRMVVKHGHDQAFIEAWKDMTQLIAKHANGLGSRLHHEESNVYIAYAQWPSKEAWGNAGDQLPQEVEEIRVRMRSAAQKTEVLHTLHLKEDLLID